MNKTSYRDFHTYTEANSEFILSEEQKASNTNKTSDTKKSKDNSNGATNAGNNKYKYSKYKKKYHKSNNNSRVNKN